MFAGWRDTLARVLRSIRDPSRYRRSGEWWLRYFTASSWNVYFERARCLMAFDVSVVSNDTVDLLLTEEQIWRKAGEKPVRSEEYQTLRYVISICTVLIKCTLESQHYSTRRENLSLFTASAIYLFEITSLIFAALYLSRFHIFFARAWSHAHANDSEYIPRTNVVVPAKA